MSDAVIVALITLAGTVFTTIITAVGNRKALSNKIDGVDTRLKNHIEDDAKNNAVQCRARILRFRNDLRHGSSFDEDYWNAILRDITDYKKFCSSHPDFPNEIAVHAIEYVGNKYDELLNDEGFAVD